MRVNEYKNTNNFVIISTIDILLYREKECSDYGKNIENIPWFSGYY